MASPNATEAPAMNRWVAPGRLAATRAPNRLPIEATASSAPNVPASPSNVSVVSSGSVVG